ncbi:MAG TPA: hypothetical protein DEG69_16955 [Flavobacteriaceae bacterium]|nr:hypothetical protein [Flavobacteriaceae bacterium]
MNLIISAGLSEPPSESLPFRYVTSVSKCDYKLDVLLESEQEMKDMYWGFLRKRGMLDYVQYIITPEEKENGIRVDFELNYPKTVVTQKITLENQQTILKHIAFLTVLK